MGIWGNEGCCLFIMMCRAQIMNPSALWAPPLGGEDYLESGNT